MPEPDRTAEMPKLVGLLLSSCEQELALYDRILALARQQDADLAAGDLEACRARYETKDGLYARVMQLRARIEEFAGEGWTVDMPSAARERLNDLLDQELRRIEQLMDVERSIEQKLLGLREEVPVI